MDDKAKHPQAEAKEKHPQAEPTRVSRDGGSGDHKFTKTGSPPVSIVLPEFTGLASSDSETAKRQQTDLPDEVLAAFSVLGLDSTATFDQIKSAFYELFEAYYRQASRPKRKQFAESKTNEITSAYRVLRRFYAINRSPPR